MIPTPLLHSLERYMRHELILIGNRLLLKKNVRLQKVLVRKKFPVPLPLNEAT